MPFHFLFTFNISKRSTVILTFLPVFLLIFCKSWFLDTLTYSSASCIPILTYYSTRKFSLASQTGLIKIDLIICYEGFPVCASGKEPTFPYRRCKRHRFDCCIGKIPWRRQWQPIPVFLPGESHGARSLVGYSPQGRKELDTTEWLHFHFHHSFNPYFSLLIPILHIFPKWSFKSRNYSL